MVIPAIPGSPNPSQGERGQMGVGVLVRWLRFSGVQKGNSWGRSPGAERDGDEGTVGPLSL